VIVGKKGWHYEKVFQIINKMKLNKKIHFIDYASDTEVIGLYSQAKLFAFPSLWEGFGIPVIEAMSVGCPVITSLNSSLPEAGGKAAKYINPKKVLEIKKAIELMLQSQNQENIEKGFIQAKKFDWEKSSRKLLEIFDNSINNK
jgi:glycosyltransferase involved in cell wall biosynthesis